MTAAVWSPIFVSVKMIRESDEFSELVSRFVNRKHRPIVELQPACLNMRLLSVTRLRPVEIRLNRHEHSGDLLPLFWLLNVWLLNFEILTFKSPYSIALAGWRESNRFLFVRFCIRKFWIKTFSLNTFTYGSSSDDLRKLNKDKR